ncbi:MAG: glycine cleavage system protein GcvH [Deltaproteobacteria bacterium]|nr:glycine cleavage system protein GcvH [Deltaproteobacteria bacterium]
MTAIPSDLRYTRDHEWARSEADGTVRVGITRHAVEALGDVTLVSFSVKPGDALTAGKAFGVVESVKAVSDLYAPVTGTVVAVNNALLDRPEAVNEGPYADGWMLSLRPEAADNALGALLDAGAYEAFLGTL